LLERDAHLDVDGNPLGIDEELPWLKGRDLELVMGEALCNWVSCRLPG
jgi:hypothetical protein